MPLPLARQLQQDISTGKLGDAAGTLPGQQALCQRYRVSRASLREALAQLQAIGLISSSQGRRSQIISPSSSDLAEQLGQVLQQHDWHLGELMASRRCIECEMAAAAAMRASAEHISSMQQAIEQFRLAANTDAALTADQAFHSAIATAAGNSMLALLYRCLRHLIREQQAQTLDQHEGSYVIGDHQRIAAAIAAGDPPAARQAMELHLRATEAKLLPKPN